MLEVKVTGGEISEQEKQAYIDRAIQKHKNQTLTGLDIHIDGDYVELTYHTAAMPFNRIRRITGYLVGDMSHWNNAKSAEERDRVKHINVNQVAAAHLNNN